VRERKIQVPGLARAQARVLELVPVPERALQVLALALQQPAQASGSLFLWQVDLPLAPLFLAARLAHPGA
jgi:hypothetical protein